MKKLFIVLLLIINNIYAIENIEADNQQENLQKQKMLEYNNIINNNSLYTKRLINRYRRFKAIINDSYDMKILLKPLVLPLFNIETIYLHPNFVSTITFPASFKILSAQTTMHMKVFQYQNNLLLLSPIRGNDIANLVITAYDNQTKQNKVFNFLLKPYSLTLLKYDTKYGMYATDFGDYLSFNIKFVEKVNINPINILEKYVEVFGLKHFRKVFSKNGYYDSILINHIPIYITRDDVQGNIIYDNKKFRISIGVKQ